MLSRLLLSSVLLFGLARGARGADDDVRFSKALATNETSSIGLNRLSSDQIAVLDALVRRDATKAGLVTKTPRPARFSQRLSTDERRNAGLDQLTEPEIAELDVQVAKRLDPPAASGSGFAAAAAAPALPGVKIRRGPEVHGEISLMVGTGSHGYSAYGGAMAVSVDDPASGLGFAVGYSEIHSKGGFPYGYYRGGYYGAPDLWRYDRFGYPRW